MPSPIVLATRRSPLALAQTGWVRDRLVAAGHDVELLEIVTTGDRWSAAGGVDATRGLFVKELEEALLDGRADLAVHSAKDLPGELPDGLAILGVPAREDPRDVLVGPVGGVTHLRPGDRVGTGSPRRAAQLALARPDVDFVEVRGNVGTRLGKLDAGEFDALVLAAAGLARLGLAPGGVSPLDVAVCVPAPGQGALAIEGRVDSDAARAAAGALDDPGTAECLRLERAVLAGLGGGCREPVGALARLTSTGTRIDVFAASGDGSRHARRSAIVDGDGAVSALVAELAAEIGRV